MAAAAKGVVRVDVVSDTVWYVSSYLTKESAGRYAQLRSCLTSWQALLNIQHGVKADLSGLSTHKCETELNMYAALGVSLAKDG